MFTVVGIIIALMAVFGGFALDHGHFGVFINAWTEYVTICGSGIGIFIAANGFGVVKRTISEILHLLQPSPYSKQEFLNLLAILYQIFSNARKDGLLSLESHVENPDKSPIFMKYPAFLHNHHAIEFLCDNIKVIMSGGVPAMDLNDMMEMDLESHAKEAHQTPDAIANAADALPALGIVACVLGVVITMGKIGGDPREIGESVGVALVGTFLGIGVSYLIVTPIARAIGNGHMPGEVYLNCIRLGLHSFARGDAPMTCVEFARRNIPSELRSNLAETEKFCKAAGKS